MPASRSAALIAATLGFSRRAASHGCGSPIAVNASPLPASAEKSTDASTLPCAWYTVRSPAMNDGTKLTSSSMSTVDWNLPRAAVYRERSLS